MLQVAKISAQPARFSMSLFLNLLSLFIEAGLMYDVLLRRTAWYFCEGVRNYVDLYYGTPTNSSLFNYARALCS